MGPLEAVQNVFLNFATFKGRAARSEYWWFILFYTAVSIGAGVADAQKLYTAFSADTFSFDTRIAGYWTPWVMLVMFLPYHTVTVRRLHDGGFSGWWMLGLVYAPAIAYPFVMIGSAMNQVATLDQTGIPQTNTTMIAYAVLSGLCSLTFLAMLLWPSQRGENRFGPGKHEHHAVGGGNFMATGNAASGVASGAPATSNNPWSALRHLDRADRPFTEAEAKAHRAEIKSLYRQKILGEVDDDTSPAH